MQYRNLIDLTLFLGLISVIWFQGTVITIFLFIAACNWNWNRSIPWIFVENVLWEARRLQGRMNLLFWIISSYSTVYLKQPTWLLLSNPLVQDLKELIRIFVVACRLSLISRLAQLSIYCIQCCCFINQFGILYSSMVWHGSSWVSRLAVPYSTRRWATLSFPINHIHFTTCFFVIKC